MKYGLVKVKLELETSIWIYPLFDSKFPNALKLIILSDSYGLI